MPLERSPKGSPKIAPPETSASVPDLTKIPNPNFNNRPLKRKQGDDLNIFMDKMQAMFTLWSTQQENKFEQILNTVQTIKVQNVEISNSIEFISKQYDTMNEKVEKLEQERKLNLDYIRSLEERVETMEKNSKNSSIELRNVPITKPETYEDLKKIVTNMGDALGVNIQPYDIKNIYRINSKSSESKPIIADFNSIPVKENLISKAKSYSKQHDGNRLSTNDLSITGTPQPVYLSENLTQKTKKLHFYARDFARLNEFAFCWISYGKVYLRKKQGDPAIRIDNELDLKKLSQPK